MNIINWIKENILTLNEADLIEDEGREVYACPLREDHQNITYKYAEKYLNALNPNHRYDVREELKSGTIITHEENVSLQYAKDYVRKVWVASHPPNMIVEVTTSW